MAYRKLDSVVVEQVLRRWQSGESARSIARAMQLDRKTVGRWLTSATKLALPRDRELTEGEVRSVIRRSRKHAAPRPPSDEWVALLAHRERIAAWIVEPRPLPLSVVHLMLERDHGVHASYATLRRFAIRELRWRRVPDASPRASVLPIRPSLVPPSPPSSVRISVMPSPMADGGELMGRLAAR